MKILGIIGIRSGSKGVKDKNIKPLLGKPLVGWVIDAARKSKYLNRIIVSTDSEKYVDVVKSLGAEAPYLRPSNLATDDSPEIEYIIDILNLILHNK